MTHLASAQTVSPGPIAIYYEHPEWFRPLFAELDRRGVSYERLAAAGHRYDPAQRSSPYSLIVNRMSPSAYTRGHGHAIAHTRDYLWYLSQIGANVLNGHQSYSYEISKARQLSLFERLGLSYPRSRVINHPDQAVAAAAGMRFPVVVKPNIGGSGAGIQKFETVAQLAEAVEQGAVSLGLDQIALVQEFLPARDGSIIRVEVLGEEYLYAIRVHLQEGEFNLCPADYCQTPETAEAAPARDMIEGYAPPAEAISAAVRIMAAAGIEVGGVEYLVDDRTGQITYYDVNALSNFVADAPRVVGFDPFPKLVDYILARAGFEGGNGRARPVQEGAGRSV